MPNCDVAELAILIPRRRFARNADFAYLWGVVVRGTIYGNRI